jgi:predicted transcriptional regulator
MPVEIPTSDEKFWKYLVKHKRPTTAAKLAKFFMVSESHAGRALKFFADSGLADVIKIGTTKYYKVKE